MSFIDNKHNKYRSESDVLNHSRELFTYMLLTPYYILLCPINVYNFNKVTTARATECRH